MKMSAEALKRRRQTIQDGPVWKFIGMSIEKMADGESLVHLPVTKELTQLHGNVHGGILATMIDGSMATALNSELAENEFTVTTEMKVNYMKGANTSLLKAEGKVIKRGRTLSVCQAEVYDAEGQLLCFATGTFYVFTR